MSKIRKAIKALNNVIAHLEDYEEILKLNDCNTCRNKNCRPWIYKENAVEAIEMVEPSPSAEPKRGKWILDRSGAYCCSECMEPCASYAMMKPRDKFCKMCGSRNEVTE